MPKKKSVRKAAERLAANVTAIQKFLTDQRTVQTSKRYLELIHDYAIIWLYMEFEQLMLDALVGAVNNNTATLSARTGILFPKHLTDEVCTYLIVADGYFDFRGRAGLIQKLKEFVPDGHYLLRAVSDEKYRTALDRVSVLRNYAAHGSQVAKNRAKETLKLKKLSSAGAWVSKQGRFDAIASKLLALSKDIHAGARY